MHLKRWITALIALPFLIFLVCEGGLFFTVLVGVVCLLAMGEYFRIAFNPRGKTISGLILVLGMLMGEGMIWAAHENAVGMIPLIVAFNLILAALFSLTQFKSDPHILENTTKQVQSVVYIPISLSFLVLIRNGADGTAWIFFILCLVFAGDVGAYYVGRAKGKHKLCPSVSPGKTVEGALGGLAANLLMGILFKCLFIPEITWGWGVCLFLAAGAAGQVGDLFESEFKRFSGVKDSGIILPGHGGILDRIDALLFAAPVVYLFKAYIFKI